MFDFSTINKGTAVLEIIILMLVAAIIAFVIAWIYWSRRYKRLQGEFDQYRKENEAKYAALLADFNQTKDLLAKTQAELAECKKRGESLTREVSNLKLSLQGKERELQTAESDRSVLRAKVTGLQGDIKGLNAHLATLQTSKTNLEASLAASMAEKAGLETENAALQAEVKKLKAAAKKAKPAAKAAAATGAAAVAAKTKPEAKTKAKAKAKPKAKAKKPKLKPEEVLANIEQKRGTINFERIGEADAANKDDLKVISGIGPFIEKKLNALGIYTFLQISRFLPEDEASVTKAIAFFPGRIQRDEWVKQATALAVTPS